MRAFDYKIETTNNKIVAALSFADFDQSMRFMDALTKFILAERRPPQILDDIAWYYQPTDTGSVT